MTADHVTAAEMTDDNPPRRRFTISIDADGDTLDDAISMVKHFLSEVSRGSRKCITGGYCRCGAVNVTERPDVTHESHEAALEKWLENREAP